MIAWRLLRAAVLAFAGAVVTLAQLNLPSRAYWDRSDTLQWACVGIVAWFILLDAGRSVDHVVKADRIRAYRDNLRALCTAAIAQVVDTTGAPWDEVAVRFYRWRGVGPWRRLVPVIAAKAGADLDEGRRAFKSGESVVGVAAQYKVMQAEEWAEFVRRATELGPDAWTARKPRERYGLNWGQLQRSASGAARGVVVNPTFDVRGDVDGCVEICGPLKTSDLVTEQMRRTLADVAGTLNRLGPPPRGWWAK